MVDTMDMSKQKGYALEALCLLATVGVVDKIFAEEFPASPQPKRDLKSAN